jgi:hypothetical protein
MVICVKTPIKDEANNLVKFDNWGILNKFVILYRRLLKGYKLIAKKHATKEPIV